VLSSSQAQGLPSPRAQHSLCALSTGHTWMAAGGGAGAQPRQPGQFAPNKHRWLGPPPAGSRQQAAGRTSSQQQPALQGAARGRRAQQPQPATASYSCSR
jgi:hypothetical protein